MSIKLVDFYFIKKKNLSRGKIMEMIKRKYSRKNIFVQLTII